MLRLVASIPEQKSLVAIFLHPGKAITSDDILYSCMLFYLVVDDHHGRLQRSTKYIILASNAANANAFPPPWDRCKTTSSEAGTTNGWGC